MITEDQKQEVLREYIASGEAVPRAIFDEVKRQFEKYKRASEQSQWIVVADAMPKKNECVLVWCPKYATDWAIFRDGCFYDQANGVINMDYITHWQTLPEPPKQ